MEPTRIVVDLTDVAFMDSSGLGALIGGLRRLRARGGELRIVSGHASRIRRILKRTGIDRLFSQFDSADQASTA